MFSSLLLFQLVVGFEKKLVFLHQTQSQTGVVEIRVVGLNEFRSFFHQMEQMEKEGQQGQE